MASTDINNLFSVEGRVALITGGTSGIGLMIAKGLVSNGANVYVCGLKDDPIELVERSLNDFGKESGGIAIGFPCDLTSKEGIKRVADHIRSYETHLDILISNAGIRRDPPKSCNVLTAPLPELQESLWSSGYEDWTTSFQINTTAHYFLSVAIVDLLASAADIDMGNGRKGRDSGRGVIVITSSCASMHNATNVDMTSYASTKAATDHLVALLAVKFARWYVRVCGINPGFLYRVSPPPHLLQNKDGKLRVAKISVVPSNMNPIGTGSNSDIFSGLVDKVPAKRAGCLDDMAGVILFLASKAGAYVNGKSIVVDGGRTLFANGQV